MTRRILISLLLLMAARSSWSLNEARLMALSDSGQTAVLNLGHLDGIGAGDYGVIVKQIRPHGVKNLNTVPVARARNIKLHSDSSIWILYHIYDPKLLVKGDKFLVFSESSVLNGQRERTSKSLTVVGHQGKVNDTTKSVLNYDKDRLSKLDEKYRETTQVHEDEIRMDADFELIDVEKWAKVKDTRYRTPLYRGPHKEEFKRKLRLDAFQGLVTEYLRKVNDPDFNYESFYENQMREDFSNEFRKKTNFNTEYEDFLYTQSSKATSDAKLYRSILEKGESWSEDFSDEELHRILSNVSVLQEKDRRALVMAKPKRYMFAFDYGLPLSDAQTEDDPLYRRESRYYMEAEFEAIPFLGHASLERFTLTASFRMNRTAFSNSGLNAELNENAVSFGSNWYPLHASNVVESPVFFLGVYFRGGYAQVQSPSTGEKGNYTTMVMPGLRTGMKYNFKNNFGIRVSASMETLELDRYETSKIDGVLPDRTKLVESKMAVGLAYAF